MKIEVLKYPNEETLKWVKQCTLNTECLVAKEIRK